MTAIVEYSKTEAGLAELRGRLAGVLYDVTKPAEMERAKKDRRECVTLRTTLEATRSQLKSGLLEQGRLIDGEAKRIRESIEAVESPIDEQIKKEETRKEAERAAKEKADAERIATIRAKITALRKVELDALGKDSAGIAMMRDELAATLYDLKWGEQFGAFADEAGTARDVAVVQLENLHVKKLAEETESARLKAEREELDRQRQEQEAANAAERARIAKESAEAERAAKAQRNAEQAIADAERKAADAKAKAEREEADRIAKAERDEQARIAKQRQDELDRQARELAAAQRKAAADAEAKRLADLQAERIAAEAALDKHKGDKRMAAFLDLAMAYGHAEPGTPTLQALAALCDAYAELLPTRQKESA